MTAPAVARDPRCVQVACLRCGARAGYRCRRPSGEELMPERSHGERDAAWRQVDFLNLMPGSDLVDRHGRVFHLSGNGWIADWNANPGTPCRRADVMRAFINGELTGATS